MADRSIPRAAVGALVLATLLAGCGSTVQVTSSGSSAGDSGLDGTQATAPLGDATSSPGAGLGGDAATGTPGSTDGSAPGPAATAGTPGSTSTGAPQPLTGGIPVKGPGWDQHSVYIGVTTEEDLGRYVGTLGLSFDPGSIQADVRAVVADVNAHGGVFGRKVVPVFHDNDSASIQTNAQAASSENCTDLTQDHHVIAALNAVAPLENDNFLRCFQKAHTPLLSIGYSTYDSSVYRTFGPTLYTVNVPDMSAFIPAYVPALQKTDFFGGWDTNLGRPSKAAPVLGLLEPDTAMGHSAGNMLDTALRKAGVKVGADYYYAENATSYSSSTSAAILKFKTAGVTHIMDITNVAAPLLFFGQNAQQQDYHPRYGMTSWLLPDQMASLFAQSGVQGQLTGAVGMGWMPNGDTGSARPSPSTASQKDCRRIMLAAHIDNSASNKRFAELVSQAICDSVHVVVDAALTGHGFGPQAIAAGMAGPVRFTPSVTFTSALSAARHSVPGSMKPFAFDASCSCFGYSGAATRF